MVVRPASKRVDNWCVVTEDIRIVNKATVKSSRAEARLGWSDCW